MHTVTRHRGLDELVAALEEIRRAPADDGTLAMIVRRPAIDQREVLNEGRLEVADGLVGDNWKSKPSSRTPDQSPHPDMQLNLMNARVIDLIAGIRERWALAGDQLYVDLDLSVENLPPGTRLRIGTAVIEVTSQPHTGCAKFVERFGLDAMKFVNSPDGRRANLRGINARVVVPGTIHVGDRITKERPCPSLKASESSS